MHPVLCSWPPGLMGAPPITSSTTIRSRLHLWRSGCWRHPARRGLVPEGSDPLVTELFLFFFFVFLPFLGPLPWHMEVPRLGVESEL